MPAATIYGAVASAEARAEATTQFPTGRNSDNPSWPHAKPKCARVARSDPHLSGQTPATRKPAEYEMRMYASPHFSVSQRASQRRQGTHGSPFRLFVSSFLPRCTCPLGPPPLTPAMRAALRQVNDGH